METIVNQNIRECTNDRVFPFIAKFANKTGAETRRLGPIQRDHLQQQKPRPGFQESAWSWSVFAFYFVTAHLFAPKRNPLNFLPTPFRSH